MDESDSFIQHQAELLMYNHDEETLTRALSEVNEALVGMSGSERAAHEKARQIIGKALHLKSVKTVIEDAVTVGVVDDV